ncbi:MAG: pimeloyl-ACP methyl ester esterase BioH [Gallionella sp.]
MTDLHVETQGSGAPLLLIHGWGMHGGMWGGVVAALAQDNCVHVVDLPGHGFSGKPEVESGKSERGTHLPLPTSLSPIDQIVAQLAAQFPEPLTVCGWSLGGQIALRWAALHPQQIQRLVLISSTPCFTQQEDWTCAMAADTLAGFAASLSENYALTLRRFLALQVRGSDNERELLANLRNALFSRGEPELAALQAGLDILRDSDQRAVLAGIAQPTLVIAGERDTLTPLAASEYLASTLPNARLAGIKGAAHAPFMSHPEHFIEQLKNFLHE